MRVRFDFIASSVVMLSSLAGCGGSTPSATGPSLTDQMNQALRLPSPEARANALAAIGGKQAAAMDLAGAEKSFNAAIKACDEIADPGSRVIAAANLAKACKQGRQILLADKALKSAQAAYALITQPELQPAALVQVATAQLASGSKSAAQDSAAKVEELVGKLPPSEDQARALSSTAVLYHQLGKSAETERVTAAALKVAAGIENPRARCRAILQVAADQHAIGRAAPSADAVKLAIETGSQVEDPYSQAFALVDVAKQMTALGQAKQSVDVLNQALAAAKKVPASDLRKEAEQLVEKQLAATPKG